MIMNEFLNAFNNIFCKFTKKYYKKTLTQFVKFGIIGISNTIISYAINVVVLFFLKPFHMTWDYIVGNLSAFVLSVLWSFYWNNRFVFKTEKNGKRHLCKALAKTYIAYGFTGIFLNNLLSLIWISCMNISKYMAPLLNSIISVPINFILNKIWAFKT